MRALAPHYPDEGVGEWALRFLDPSDSTETMAMLRAMTRGIRERFAYVRRPEKGVQTPDETLESRRGSCRDLAVLMMEAARSLGVASRFVSGYIYAPERSGLAGGGATHAWMQAYLPGAGWIDFDPTEQHHREQESDSRRRGVGARVCAAAVGYLLRSARTPLSGWMSM